ncbi:hypothetical protein RRG08_030064 [Elysia crispata]|uniref:Uncharacterized protein n=1 Tax=Elysia crispata TaxID=231223 RepID=A0AAE0YIV1_9GAST|nr:hypothetical protein RRG08_030064 [Elysia crispata]
MRTENSYSLFASRVNTAFPRSLLFRSLYQTFSPPTISIDFHRSHLQAQDHRFDPRRTAGFTDETSDESASPNSRIRRDLS